MKFIKWIADSRIRQVVTIDESQFGFIPGRGTTDASFVICQLQEKYFTADKQIYMYSAANTYFPLYLLLGETGYRVIWVLHREIIF